jgi:hypothetical protein
VLRDVARPAGAHKIDLREGLRRKPQVDAVKRRRNVRGISHGAKLAPSWRHV